MLSRDYNVYETTKRLILEYNLTEGNKSVVRRKDARKKLRIVPV